MKKLILALLLTCFTMPLLAQDVGLFYDPDRDGEGLIMLKRDNMIQFNFFTFIHRCNHRFFDSELLIMDKSYRPCRRQQAWYVTGQHPIRDGQATGVLYTANPDDRYYFSDEDDDPINTSLADVVDIGLFVLTQTPTGFDMIVLQTGNVLHPEADIYHRTYKFRQYLFGPTHPIATPVPTE